MRYYSPVLLSLKFNTVLIIKEKIMLYKSTIFKIGLLIPLLSILLLACENKSETGTEEKATDNAATSKLPVDIITAQEQTLIQEEAVVGTMVANREVSIVSELPQKITHIAFKDGSYVQKGALLYQLNDADIKSRLKQVGAELELARVNKTRMSNLLQSETVRQQEYDEVLMRFRSLEAQQELLYVELEKTRVRAPFAGKIGISKVHLGAYVVPGEPLVILQDLSSIKVNFTIPEKYSSLIQMGKQVRFATEVTDKEYTAKIYAIEPGLDAQGRSLLVQALTPNTNDQFRAGLSAKVYVSVADQADKGILVPTEALMPAEKGYSVFIIKNGVAKAMPVAISNRTEKDAIITSGLVTGDQIIISNMLRLGDGTPVEAVVAK